MKTKALLFLLLLLSIQSFAQSDKDLAFDKAMEAIKLMDEGKLDESILLLEECKKLDPKNINYPYEVALAYVFKKEYSKAIKELNRIKKDKKTNSQVFQLLGNSHSFSGNPKMALKTYADGLKKFPKAGNLYLETGNIFLHQEEYSNAIQFYEKGIDVDPEYSSNYYRAADLFLRSSNKVPGIIYGEIFMNLERTTDRTLKMSEMLYDTYNESIKLSKDSSSIDFCEIIFNAEDLQSTKALKLPYCAIFGQNFVLATIGQTELNLHSLSLIRSSFIEFYFQKDSKDYPNVLFDYHKLMIKEKVFNAYNYYLFQMGNKEEFNVWAEEEKEEYDRFVKWYTTEENELKLNAKNKYLRTQY